MTRMKPIDDSEREKIQQLLDATLPLIESTSDGMVRLYGGSIFAFEIQVFALTKQLGKRFPPMSESQMTTMVKRGVYHLAGLSDEQQSVDELFAKFNDDLKVKGDTTFQVIDLLNISPRSAPVEMVVNGITFHSIDGVKLRSLFEGDAERLRPHAFANLAKFTAYFYEVEIPSYRAIYGPEAVIGELADPFERARALLNFNHLGRQTKLSSWSIRPRPRAKYLPSPYTLVRAVGDEKNEEFSLFYNPTAIDLRFQAITEKEWTRFVDLEKRIYQLPEKTSKSTASHVDRLLRIYQQALDTTDQAVTFLHFWQVLERIASPTQIARGLETKKIISRLQTIVPLDSTQRMVLKELGEIRHSYAHQGAFPGGNGEQLNEILKSYADKCLGRTIFSLELVPRVIDVEEYYAVAVDPAKARLQALENAIKIVRSNQNSGSSS